VRVLLGICRPWPRHPHRKRPRTGSAPGGASPCRYGFLAEPGARLVVTASTGAASPVFRPDASPAAAASRSCPSRSRAPAAGTPKAMPVQTGTSRQPDFHALGGSHVAKSPDEQDLWHWRMAMAEATVEPVVKAATPDGCGRDGGRGKTNPATGRQRTWRCPSRPSGLPDGAALPAMAPALGGHTGRSRRIAAR